MVQERPSRPYVERDLIEDIKTKYPETKGMNYTTLVEWALRKLLTLNLTEA